MIRSDAENIKEKYNKTTGWQGKHTLPSFSVPPKPPFCKYYTGYYSQLSINAAENRKPE